MKTFFLCYKNVKASIFHPNIRLRLAKMFLGSHCRINLTSTETEDIGAIGAVHGHAIFLIQRHFYKALYADLNCLLAAPYI